MPQHERDHEVLVADPSKGAQRVLGSFGEGPGEFLSINALAIGRADSVVVLHDETRITVFDSAGAMGRTLRVPPTSDPSASNRLLALEDGRVVIAGREYASEREDRLHLVSSEGESVRSFGSPEIMGGGREAYSAQDGSIWELEVGNYRLEKRDSTGRSLRVIGVESPGTAGVWLSREHLEDFIANQDPPPERGSDEPLGPTFRLAGIHELAFGRLIIAVHVPLEHWRELPLRPHHGETATRIAEESQQDAYRTLIDVVDVPSGELLARTEAPGYGRILNDGSFAVTRYSQEGIIQVELFEIAVREGDEGR